MIALWIILGILAVIVLLLLICLVRTLSVHPLSLIHI